MKTAISENLVRTFESSSRVKVKYRDKEGFIVWGIVLAISADRTVVYVDSLTNSVSINSVLEVKSL